MALRGTLTHWKTRVLAAKLDIPPCYALGLLEALWHTTAELAPGGNIGRLPDNAIAMEMFYAGDAEQLIAALIESGHLDRHGKHRLIVHDWAMHADYNTKRKLKRREEPIFANNGKALDPVTRHAPPPTSHNQSKRVITPHKSIPEPEPEPEPEPTPSSLRSSGGSASPTPLAGEDNANVGDKAPVRPQASGKQRGALTGVKRQENSANSGRKAVDVVSDSVSRRLKWLLTETKEFWVRVNDPVMRSKGTLSTDDMAGAPWSGRDQEAAVALLEAHPTLTQEQARRCLEHRFISVELRYFTPNLPASKWLRDLPSFLHAPLNRFNEPVKKRSGRYIPSD